MVERLTAVFAIILLVNFNISTGKPTGLQTDVSYMSALTKLGFCRIHIKGKFYALFKSKLSI